MPLPLSDRQRKAVEDAARERTEFQNRCERTFLVDDVDLTHFVTSLRYEGDDSTPGCLLTATLKTRLSNEGLDSVIGTEVLLVFTVIGDESTEEIVGFRGEVASVATARGHSTIKVVTGGNRVGRSLKRSVEYVNTPPETVLFDATSGLPYAGYELDAPERPLITRTGDDELRWNDTHADLISLVKDEARVVLADMQINVARCYVQTEIPTDYAWEIEEGVDTRAFGDVRVSSQDEQRFAFVVVYRTSRIDGTVKEIARAEVENHGIDVDPDDTYDIEYSDGESEDEEYDSAYELAFSEAQRLSTAPVKLDVPLIYWLFHLVRGDGILVTTHEVAVEDDVDGEWIRTYLMREDAFDFGPSLASGSVSGEAKPLTSRWIERKRPPLDGLRRRSGLVPLRSDTNVSDPIGGS